MGVLYRAPVDPEPFRAGEVVGWWEADLPDVRLLSVDSDDGSFEGEFVDRPGEIFRQDCDSICHRTPAYDAWRAVLLDRFAALGVTRDVRTANARRQAWQEATRNHSEIWQAVKREHPTLDLG